MAAVAGRISLRWIKTGKRNATSCSRARRTRTARKRSDVSEGGLVMVAGVDLEVLEV